MLDLFDVRLLGLDLDRFAEQVLLLLGHRHLVEKVDALLVRRAAAAARALALEPAQLLDLPLLLAILFPRLELAVLLGLLLLR